MIRRLLYWVGYLLAPVLFAGADTPQAIVRRLRFAYRLVGVRIVDTPSTNDVERTVFRCPYRNLGAARFGPTWVCHDILDRVDDGYVTYLHRHKNIRYQRPRGCEHGSDCAPSHCYSEVSALD